MKLVSTQDANNQNIYFRMLGWGAGPGVKSHIPLGLNKKKKNLGEFSCASGDIARGCWQRLLIQEIFQPLCALHLVYYSTYKHVSVFVVTMTRFQNGHETGFWQSVRYYVYIAHRSATEEPTLTACSTVNRPRVITTFPALKQNIRGHKFDDNCQVKILLWWLLTRDTYFCQCRKELVTRYDVTAVAATMWNSSGRAVQSRPNFFFWGKNKDTKIYICNAKSCYNAQWLLWLKSGIHKSRVRGRPDY